LQLKTGEHFKFATTVDSLLAAAIAQEEAAAQNQIRANAKYLKVQHFKITWNWDFQFLIIKTLFYLVPE